MKIQPQSGIGDLIFALPLIYDLSLREDVEIATNHWSILDGLAKLGNIGKLCEVGVNMDNMDIPIINEGFTHLRYDRYGVNYFDRYYHPYGKLLLDEAISKVRETYMQGRRINKNGEYAVYAPPRAARCHIKKSCTEKFMRAPDPIYAKRVIDSYNLPMAIVGKEDEYSPIMCMPETFIDMRDRLSFDGLCDIVANASCVISQISSITALAGLFGIPTHYLKAAEETEEQHNKHINGVVWPGQEILK
jgi:hypothetical protein